MISPVKMNTHALTNSLPQTTFATDRLKSTYRYLNDNEYEQDRKTRYGRKLKGNRVLKE